MEKMLDLGNQLELWKVRLDELIEQDENARAMPKAMMDRLADTIGRDQRLESLPFCALTDRGVEVVSGHHRTRSARKAGMEEIYVLVDVSGLTPAQIAAKQLAHNSIQGDDDPQLVKRIFEKIDAVHLQLEAFIDPEKIVFRLDRVSVGQLKIAVPYETVMINFMPVERERFNAAIEAMTPQLTNKDVMEHHISVLENFERFREAVAKLRMGYNILSTGTAIDQMARLALEALDLPTGDDTEDMVPLPGAIGTNVLPAALAKKLKKRIKADIEAGVYGKHETWKLLETLLDQAPA